MNKVIVLLFLICTIPCYSQNNNAALIPYKQTFSVYLSPSLFIPVNLDEKRLGFGTEIGVQWNYKDNTSLCLDYDLAYTVKPGYDYGSGIYRGTSPSIWNTYMMLTAGVKFYFPLNEKLKLFCTPGLGVISMRKRANQSDIAPAISFEFGGQYKLNYNFSTFCKLKYSTAIPLGVMGGSFIIGGASLFNIGIGYQF